MSIRIWASLLALCITISFFAFNASAYNDYPAVTLQLPNGPDTVAVVDGVVPYTYTLDSNTIVNQTIRTLYVVRPKKNTYINFVLSPSWPTSIYSTLDANFSIGTVSDSNWIVVARKIRIPYIMYYVNDSNGNATVPTYGYKNAAFWSVKYVGEDATGVVSVNLNSTVQLLTNGNSMSGFLQFSNVSITTDISQEIDIIQNLLDSVDMNMGNLFTAFNTWANGSGQNGWIYTASTIDQIQGYVYDLRRKLTVTNTFDFNSVSYDDQGNATVLQGKTTWYQAILNTLNSLAAPVAKQAQMEQVAKEAGANDALDTAYDSLGDSFGALGDFSGLGSLGSFDGNALGSSGQNGLLAWFSQTNADAIDAVPKSKAPNDIIDFYSGKIVSYLEEVSSDDSAVVGGN